MEMTLRCSVKDRCLEQDRLNILGRITEATEAPVDLRSDSNFRVQVLCETYQDNIDVIHTKGLLSNNNTVDCTNAEIYILSPTAFFAAVANGTRKPILDVTF